MQAFLNQYNEGNVNEMFLCNSADYSMFYPMVGNLRFTGNDTENINKTFQDTSTYLSCSVKSVQNFFVPLTLKEKNKLFIVKLLFEEELASKIEIIKDIFLFAEKYKGGLNNKTLIKLLEQAKLEFLVTNQPDSKFSTESSQNNIDIFNRTNYEEIKKLFNKIIKSENKEQHKALILLLEYYFSFLYVSFRLRKDSEAKNIYDLIINAPNNILKTLLILNTNIFKNLFIPGFDKLKFNLKQAGLFMEEDAVIGAETGSETGAETGSETGAATGSATEGNAKEGNTKELFELIKMDEVISTFFDPDSEVVSFAEINFTIEQWKVCYIYADYILRFKNIEIVDSVLKEGGVEEDEFGNEGEEENDSWKYVPGEIDENARQENNGGKRRNKSKKNGKKSNKRQTRKVNK